MALTNPHVETVTTHSRGSQKPILITGSHRSGTTWVGHVLAAASGVGYISEPFSPLHRPGVFAYPTPRWFPYVQADSSGEITNDVGRMLAFDYSVRSELPSIRSARDVGRMVRDYSRCRSLRSRSARPLVKDPLALLAAPWLATTFDMRVVVLVRHPAAFASSLKRMGWTHPFSDFLQPGLLEGPLAPFAADIEEFAQEERPVLEQAALLWSALNWVVLNYRDRFDGWRFVRHEDLSMHPREGFGAIFEHVGLPFDRAALQALESSTAAENPAEAEPGRAHTLHRDSKANVLSWKTRLEPAEIELIRERTASVAGAFYDDEDW